MNITKSPYALQTFFTSIDYLWETDYPIWRLLNMKPTIFVIMLMAALLSACSGFANNPATAVPTSDPFAAQTQVAPALVSAPSTDLTIVAGEGSTAVDQTVLSAAISNIQPGSLTTAEEDALRYMREEEKLAHDVYMTLYDQWRLPVFQNIANSEQTHTEAVRTLLDRYSVPDPASVEVGVFTDQTLQDLYNQLVQQGSQSLAEALKVGAAIEEIDILDLEERLAQTEKADIILVYDNLMKGSRNHLRSFVSTLQTQSGETYQPQYLSPDAYQAIIGAPIESGGQGNPGGKGPGNGRP
jgi:hypothetical protein